MAKKLKPAKDLRALINMDARLMSDALIAGQTATRTYVWSEGPWSSRGPWDADMIDHVFSEVQRFIDDEQLSERDIGSLLWNRSLKKWLMGRFEEAAEDAEIAVRIAERLKESPSIVENKQKSLRFMRERRCHLDMLE